MQNTALNYSRSSFYICFCWLHWEMDRYGDDQCQTPNSFLLYIHTHKYIILTPGFKLYIERKLDNNLIKSIRMLEKEY